MSKPVRIAVAEPSLILRKGVMSVLGRLDSFPMELVEIGEMEQLKHSLSWQKPDVLMINPASLGLVTPQQLCKEAGRPDMKCVALVFALTDAASLKNYAETISIYDSAEAIREKLSRLINAPEQPDRRHESLSAREKEVIVCVIQGMTNKQIADKLYLSTHTIITHRRNISAKLQIHSTAGLTIYAIVNKLVELDSIQQEGKE